MIVAWLTDCMSWVSDIRFAKFSTLKILTFSNNKLHFIHKSIRTSDNHEISADGAVLYTFKGFRIQKNISNNQIKREAWL